MSDVRPAVEVRSLRKTFGSRVILDGFSMEALPGEFVAIMGPSGSGKSTLLNIIGLLDTGDGEGAVQLFGVPAPRPGSRGARSLLRSKMAYLFQEPALVDDATVEANLKLAQRYSSAPRNDRARQRAGALKEVGLAGLEASRVYQLSGGEQQRLALACIRMHPSDLVLADEPTGSLDEGNRDHVVGHLRRLANEGKTVLVVTHDPAVAAQADRIVQLDGAR